MRTRFAGFILIFISTISFAQKDLRPGYILLTEQDTVFGEIIYNRNVTNFKYCRFIAENDTVPISYKPMDIHGYRYQDEKIYISQIIKENDENIPYFLELLFDSELDLFFLLDQQKERYFFQKSGKEVLEIPYEDEYEVIKEGVSYVSKSRLDFCVLTNNFISLSVLR